MAQPSHNPLSFLKHSNVSNTSLERPGNTRPRSGSFLRAISLHSPHPSTMPTADTLPPLSRTNTTSSLAPSLNRASIYSSDEALEAPFSCHPEDFEIKNPIGYGSSAVVYNAIYKPKNVRIAIKMIDLDLFERNQIDELRRETALMALSKHPNVLKVHGSFVNGSKLYIATPYLSGGSCLDIMKNGFRDGFEELAIATILKQALEGLVYLHRNNHIHRDVKAGNLLMDDQGTVLLADFGVSSSLTENNEVRKTFVGTPCWMAPEVMEQSGYDFKADIWSFGITAIELATGHAPFAKFAPMKVLMMTLNQSPPTLDREHTKHKYSRLFKEMIDSCLKKDPSKRLTAEKLLLHPFFKQAKRKDYLVKSILSYVPPLDQRAHRKTGFKQTTIEKNTIQQWDFDNSDEEEQEINVSQNVNSGNEPVPVPNTTRKSHISFGDVVVNNSKLEKPDLPSPALTEPEIASPVPVRKSRFVIEDNSYPTTDRNDITMSSQRSLSPNSNNNNLSVHSRCSSTTPSATATSVFHGHSPPITADSSWQSAMGVGLGICTGSSANPGVPSAPQQQQENVEVLRKGRFSVNQHNAPTSIRTTNIDSNSKFAEGAPGLSPIQPPESPYEMRSYPMSRITSNDSIKGVERKSRFEVQHLQPQPSTPMSQSASSTHNSTPLPHDTLDNQQPQVKFETLPLTREQSSRHQRNSSRESFSSSSKVGRFSIEKEDAPPLPFEETLHPFETPSIVPGSPEYRKKGRFELTGAMTPAERLESPHTTLNGNSSQASVAAGLAALMQSDERRNHNTKSPSLMTMDPQQQQLVYALLKQTEIQKAMLQDLLFGLSHGGGVSSRARSSSATTAADVRKFSTSSSSIDSHPSFSVDSPRKPSIQSDISSTMDQLQQLLVSSYRERDRLSKENDQLKREIEKLKSQQERKQQQLLPSASAKASILKPNAPAIIELPTPSVSQPIIAEGLPSRTVIVNNDEKHGAQYATSS